MESSDDNDDSTAFFQDFLEGKKIVGPRCLNESATPVRLEIA